MTTLERRFRDAASATYNAIGPDVPGLESGLDDESFCEVVAGFIREYGDLTDDDLTGVLRAAA